MAKDRARSGQLEMAFRTHGGVRPGAGRKPRGPRAGASHRGRPAHDPRYPVHVTMRVVGSAAGLRRKDMYLAIREATIAVARRAEARGDFRLVHMSIQRDHLHLVVEAESSAALSGGLRSFTISAARHINRAFSARGERRTGRVFAERYHARPLTSPRAVRNAVAYILGNWRHHGEDQAPAARTWQVDPYSSGALFPHWKELEGSPFLWPLPAAYQPLLVFRPRTWLLQRWPRFCPPISAREVPGQH